MLSETPVVKIGHPVPNFELTIFDPVKEDFGTLSLDFLKSQKRWTILFFYPADFTFV